MEDIDVDQIVRGSKARDLDADVTRLTSRFKEENRKKTDQKDRITN